MNGDPETLKIKDDEIKELKDKKEKHMYENFLKSLELFIHYCKKKNKNLDEKKIFFIVSEILIG